MLRLKESIILLLKSEVTFKHLTSLSSAHVTLFLSCLCSINFSGYITSNENNLFRRCDNIIMSFGQ